MRVIHHPAPDVSPREWRPNRARRSLAAATAGDAPNAAGSSEWDYAHAGALRSGAICHQLSLLTIVISGFDAAHNSSRDVRMMTVESVRHAAYPTRWNSVRACDASSWITNAQDR
jgi:hypothetical protein